VIDRKFVDRFVDVASVVLISVAAVLSALCGYQSGRWDGEQTRLYNVANANRVMAAQAADRANVLAAVNVVLFLNYISAVESHDTSKAEFLYRRFPRDLRRSTDAWLATKPFTNRNAPSSPFAMPEYTMPAEAGTKGDTTAAADFQAAQVAHRHADDFSLLTVIFAGVSFLGGVSTKMAFPRHLIIITLGIIALMYGIGRLTQLPTL
jgi:hypothetical protein